MWLAWDTAALVAGCLAVASAAVRPLRRGWLTLAAEIGREAAVVLGIYAFWQKAGDFAVENISGAASHARWVWHVEQRLHIANERGVQRLVLPHPVLVQALNAFYAIVHVPALVVFLVWLFVRHRERYSWWRNAGAVLTLACLAIQLIPVAPPRLMSGMGFVDTGTKYGQSVYGPHGISIAPQLAAMPSVHVAWAVLVAVCVLAVSTSRWRWLVLLHPVLTTFAVVATANHWWLDGIVAVALLPLSMLASSGISAVSASASRLWARPLPWRLPAPAPAASAVDRA